MGRSREEWMNMAGVDPEVASRVRADAQSVFDSVAAEGVGKKTPFQGFSFQTSPTEGIVDYEEFWKKALAQKAETPPGIRHYPALPLHSAPAPEPRDYVLEGLVPCGAATAIYGEGGIAKSMLALSLALSASAGKATWLGRELEGNAALYLDFELTQDEQLRRAKALATGSGYNNLPEWLFYLSALGRKKHDIWWSAYHACAWYGIGLVIVDSLGIAMDGEAVNQRDVVEFYERWLEPFIAQDIAVLLVDHQAKGGAYQEKGAFGSVYKRNLVRSELQLEKVSEDREAGTMDVVFRHRKHNFGPLSKPFGAQLAFGGGQVLVNTVDLTQQQMMQEQGVALPDRILMAMDAIDDATTSKDISEMVGEAEQAIKAALASLKKQDRVRATGEHSYGREKVVRGPVRTEDALSRPERPPEGYDSQTEFGDDTGELWPAGEPEGDDDGFDI